MAKFKAKGVVVKAAITATPTTTVSQSAEVSFNTGDRQLVDVTTHDSTTVKDYIDSGLRESAELDMTCEYDPADTVHEIVRAAHDVGTLLYVTLILPDAGNATWVMSGIVTSFNIPSLAPGGSLKMNIKFKATSLDVFTA
jgi:hypothetical protein